MPVVVPFAQDIDVTDHAVVRWLERVCGVDVEHYRAEIRAAFVAGGLVHMSGLAGAANTYIDVPEHRVHLVVRDGTVASVLPHDEEPG